MGGTRRSGSGSGELRRELGVHKFLDSNDLDVISRAEREDVYGFAAELNAA
jgi:hypothetical protein